VAPNLDRLVSKGKYDAPLNWGNQQFRRFWRTREVRCRAAATPNSPRCAFFAHAPILTSLIWICASLVDGGGVKNSSEHYCRVEPQAEMKWAGPRQRGLLANGGLRRRVKAKSATTGKGDQHMTTPVRSEGADVHQVYPPKEGLPAAGGAKGNPGYHRHRRGRRRPRRASPPVRHHQFPPPSSAFVPRPVSFSRHRPPQTQNA